ncbi:MAG: hypothetical protein A3I26_03030 [Candidatus Yanofskybacteria bacterium RIFCSPLOWO2_02_FULL_43_10]|uniref:Uncharacterized protein n=2 Tax=Parcubacteria group TaxID=1794811 RepID=A0A1G2RQV4_9BACT|nr:MAG: hypothetical protein A2742_02085 [Candidatus Yanofskybacteria bacterium RIFCSPHIGHO2_01_FULL_43_32]OGN11796.1 MAG: hypothetical protein A3C69_00320 [Candidatus Yanofskybacteria bacterium RIFCSPHIGHO2_02_FULL_43_12]OGN18041.1 MAG: hypothetical protein A3E34_01055 [Candidatus Yanofskybacteria bacterium RIFCSPHIGHO2_12_FULL_43_11]OGN30079.1 MAG: hypothetical protein A3I26_03030 [Candidatus Yanofskybacteria bacterium RIFCSPLOWO2_02_FULL_43_10]OGN34412.1 MAG: hypothetical protein A3G51_03425
MNKQVPCNGLDCDKVWPDDQIKWHHNPGVMVGGGAVEEGADFKADEPAKMCEECFQKLPDDQKSMWSEI